MLKFSSQLIYEILEILNIDAKWLDFDTAFWFEKLIYQKSKLE